jgi:hypothetical protein
VKNGEVVTVVGRRRKASYGRIQIQKPKKKTQTSSCTLQENLAKSLRLRKGDKVKVVPLGSTLATDEDGTTRSGDMILMEAKSIKPVTSLTLSPIEDSLSSLQALEAGGDSIPDDEIKERFLTPYLEGSGGLLKQGQMLLLTDENGRKLEFLVSHMECEGDEPKSQTKKADDENENEVESPEEGSDKEEVAVAGEISEGTVALVGGSVPRPVVGLGYDSVGGLEKAIQLMRELVELPLRFP